MNGNLKRVIENTKNKHELNGNVSNKDLILYLLNKQDGFESYVKTQFTKGSGKISGNRVRSQMNFKINMILLTVLIIDTFIILYRLVLI